jgi:hypothetical protein
MRSSHSSSRTYQTYLLPPLDSVALRYQGLAQVEIRGDDSAAVIDVHDIAGKKKIADERDNSAIGRSHRLSDRPAKVDAEMAAGERSIEHSPAAEPARDR